MTAEGPETYCQARKGHVVLEARTNKRGKFDMRRLPPGRYWITYQHPEEGESFLYTVSASAEHGGPVQLELDAFREGNRCYLVDIERDVKKPRS